MHSLKLKSCILVAETLTEAEQKELARVATMIAHGVQACDTLGLELIPFVACVRVHNLMTPYRDWMRILQAWDALPKQTILIETYHDPTVINVFSKHPTLPAAILHDSGTGPYDISNSPVQYFRSLVGYIVRIYYNGVELKTVMAEKIALTPDN